jgi:hypothetical protein
MRAELLAELRAIARGEQIAPVTPVTPVTLETSYRCNQLKLQGLQELQVKRGEVEKSVFSPVTAPVTVPPEPDEAAVEERAGLAADFVSPQKEDADAIEERAGLAADRVPIVYLDAWARLNCRKPARASDAEWRCALDDGGQFLDAWGDKAVALQWTPGELFDVANGLVWRLAGERVNALGENRARLSDGRIVDRRPSKGALNADR